MKALVMYQTKYGNTEQLARTIAASMNECIPTEVMSVKDVNQRGLAGVDLLLVGGPTQAHGAAPELNQALDSMGDGSLKGVKVATFDTRLHWPKLLSGSAADVAAQHLKAAGGQMIAPPESFFIAGTEGPLAPGEMERASRWGHWIAEAVVPTATTASVKEV